MAEVALDSIHVARGAEFKICEEAPPAYESDEELPTYKTIGDLPDYDAISAEHSQAPPPYPNNVDSLIDAALISRQNVENSKIETHSWTGKRVHIRRPRGNFQQCIVGALAIGYCGVGLAVYFNEKGSAMRKLVSPSNLVCSEFQWMQEQNNPKGTVFLPELECGDTSHLGKKQQKHLMQELQRVNSMLQSFSEVM